MTLALLLALQAPVPADLGPPPVEFDLARMPAAEDCRRDGSQIVVCGRRPGRDEYDFEKWEKLFGDKPLTAEIGIGGGAVARAYVESVEMPGGQISKRIMVGIKVGF